jgi:hypothetical protein
MPPDDWKEWIAKVEANRQILARIEKKVDSIHATVYENGLSTKVNTLWEWRKDIQKILIGIITAILITIVGYFVTKPVDRGYDIEERLESIEHKLNDKVKNQN